MLTITLAKPTTLNGSLIRAALSKLSGKTFFDVTVLKDMFALAGIAPRAETKMRISG